jgi:putative molybdopterin biosynthesis protein
MSEEPMTLTIEEVARRLRVHERTVQRLLDRKELKGYKVGRVWRVDLPDLEDYVRRQKAVADDEAA